MKKLKKSSKSKSFTVVVIYGVQAVGKFTVANKLHKLINYKFFHNHHTHDLARQLFERGNFHADVLIEGMRLIIFKEITKAKLNTITTHTYFPSFISLTGLTDPVYMKKIESIISKGGGRTCFVHIVANEKEILKRIKGESRVDYIKLRDVRVMKKILKKRDWKSDAPVKNNLQINNSNLSPLKVSNMIIKHFKLK